jgi:ubiquinone/menaquinone biosynthesis C-methylase UbiE
MKTLPRRLVAFGFRLLYNELAGLYDLVSWVVSLGRWHKWQRSIWPYLPPSGCALEVGFGPGHLLVDLAAAGYQAKGLDLSPAMLRLAQRRLRRQALSVPLYRGRASALPFAAQSFDIIVVTFPTPFVYDPAWMRQAKRVLRRGGRLIIVEVASFGGRTPLERGLEWLYRITGQRSPTPDLSELLNAAGLTACRESVEVDGTEVSLILADKQADSPLLESTCSRASNRTGVLDNPAS